MPSQQFSPFVFGINSPNTEHGCCPGTYIQSVSVIDKKAKVTLHLLSSQPIAVTGFLPCSDALPSEGLQYTPAAVNCMLCVCAITGH